MINLGWVDSQAVASFSRVANAAPARATKAGGLSGAAVGRAGTFAWKGKLIGGDGAFRSLLTATGLHMSIQFRSTNNARVTLYGTDNAIKLQLDSTGVTLNVALGEITFLASWDLAAARSELYVNGVSRVTRTTVVDADLRYTDTTNIGALADYAGGSPMNCETDYLLYDNAFVDIAVAGNRDIFASATSLGANGSGATGQQPLIYLMGNAAAWNGGAANLGRGGAFGASGAFTNV